jgi:hypothetical protein
MKKILFLIILVIVMVCLNASLCSANSAEPPSILIIVPNAPADLEISIGNIKAGRTDKVIESYFTFYRSFLKSSDNTLKITTGGNSFEITLDTPLNSYNNVFTLDLKRQTLNPGKSLSRSITLISLRVALTLIIEGMVFFLFGFKKKKSWLIFLIINLITQGFLNFMLGQNANIMNSYLIFTLIAGEILVLIFEMIAFLFLVKEHGRLRTALYVIAANLLSLIAGGYLITVFPV